MLFTGQYGVNGLCQNLSETATLTSFPWFLSGTVWGLGEEGPELRYLASGEAAVPDKALTQDLLTF